MTFARKPEPFSTVVLVIAIFVIVIICARSCAKRIECEERGGVYVSDGFRNGCVQGMP